jgi:superfamily II DNA helicase RecQ
MVSFEQLAIRYFPDIEFVSVWTRLAQYWTQKSDFIINYDEPYELFYSYLLYSLTESGFTLVIEDEKNLPSLRVKFGNLNEFVFLGTEDTAENQKKAVASIENLSAKVVVVSVQRFFQKGNKFLEYLKSYQVQQIAVHNAHKISYWGSFDEIYSGLTQLKSYLKHIPIIAVLPVLSLALEKDITTVLHLHEPSILNLNSISEKYTYRVFSVQSESTFKKILQDIANEHHSQKGMLLTNEINDTFPDNLSFDFFSEETTFAVYAEPPDNLEQIYFFQKEYGINNIYVVYDEKQLKQKKNTIQSVFKQKLHQDIAIKRFEQVIQWCTAQTCKKQVLQKYWQTPVTEPCGKCNICLAEQKNISSEQHYTHDVQKLKNILTAQRLRLAKSDNILVHQVFSDVTIEELAVYLPQNKEDLTLIAGLGVKKIQLYGDAILDVILDFCASHNLSDNMSVLREYRKIKNVSKNSTTVVSVVKKAKIKASVQEVGYWNSQLIYDFLNTDEITLAEIESVINTIQF